ncbi:hypothetical protein LUX12_00050 [Streptomyces somaliensis]|uniref:hypothetical protein n=1 Tax=Streptomyces somaliensis TaxID=78355 RepID=UPI0020CC2FEA|nr:hypothetical protein [Streptomyces somaliensis]MCP9943558.1 hypothetical protein [Streptomyces somaliensis]MCP9963194.1 hypothetical protein [Streptomyces somaliensis]
MTGAGGAFEAATGDGPPLPDPGADPAAAGRRTAEVRAAYEGLLQIRRLTATAGGDPGTAPAPWERNRPVRAVALALEAAGFPPSALDAGGRRVRTGYRVGPGERPGQARVEWLGPPGGGAPQEEETALSRCARALERLGWEALLYRGPRRRRHLEVEPMPPSG